MVRSAQRQRDLQHRFETSTASIYALSYAWLATRYLVLGKSDGWHLTPSYRAGQQNLPREHKAIHRGTRYVATSRHVIDTDIFFSIFPGLAAAGTNLVDKSSTRSSMLCQLQYKRTSAASPGPTFGQSDILECFFVCSATESLSFFLHFPLFEHSLALKHRPKRRPCCATIVDYKHQQ